MAYVGHQFGDYIIQLEKYIEIQQIKKNTMDFSF